MSSGTYFPPPVRAVEIAKPHGKGTRILGVPTVGDTIAQTVAALTLEPRTEAIFHADSYGYRPGRSAIPHQKRLSYIGNAHSRASPCGRDGRGPRGRTTA